MKELKERMHMDQPAQSLALECLMLPTLPTHLPLNVWSSWFADSGTDYSILQSTVIYRTLLKFPIFFLHEHRSLVLDHTEPEYSPGLPWKRFHFSPASKFASIFCLYLSLLFIFLLFKIHSIRMIFIC